MFKIKTLVFVCAMALILPGCEEDHPNPDDQRLVDNEVKTPLQKSYDTIDECKKEFNTDGDCTSQTVTVNGESHTVFVSPFFYPWGAIYHPIGGWGYGYAVPPVSSRVTSTTLPQTVSSPNFSNSTAYSSSRISSLSATRGGFGGTARAASASSGGSGGSSGG